MFSFRALSFVLVGGILAALSSQLAIALGSSAAELVCSGRSAADVGQRVKACTSLIDSAKYSGDQLAVLLTSRGAAWRSKRQFGRALADQNEAIRLNPRSAILYFNRAVTWQSKGDAKQAIADYTEVVRLTPAFALAYKNRADAFYGLGEFDQAIADYNDAIRLKPDFAEALARRGLAKLQKGDADGRNADMSFAHSIDPAVVTHLLGSQGLGNALGQGFLVRKKSSMFTALELDGATICMQANADSEQKLKQYFDAHTMKYVVNRYEKFDDALHEYEDARCDVLVANRAALKVARRKLAQPEGHALLPEVFAQ